MLPGSYYNPAFHQAANKMIVRRSRKRIRRQNHDSGLRLAVYIRDVSGVHKLNLIDS